MGGTAGSAQPGVRFELVAELLEVRVKGVVFRAVLQHGMQMRFRVELAFFLFHLLFRQEQIEQNGAEGTDGDGRAEDVLQRIRHLREHFRNGCNTQAEAQRDSYNQYIAAMQACFDRIDPAVRARIVSGRSWLVIPTDLREYTLFVGDKPVKTLMAALIGLALATVGVDSTTGVYRFTFGSVSLSDGIQFVIVVIGFFSVSEVLLMLEKTHNGQKAVKASGRLLFNFKEFCFTFWTMVRSSLAGFVIGVLPGAGATIASAMTYMTEKRMAGPNGKFGDGDLRGLAAPEAANNASACGSLIPMLTLGVPGSGTTAVMIGALTLYNITPGPLLFDQQPDVVWGLIASLFIGNVILLVMNIPLVGLFARMLSVPNWVLVPAITVISMVGVYAVHSTTFDLVLMIGLGVFGYILRKLDFPLSALILGFVLGELMEDNLRRALSISAGDLSILWNSPISLCLWALTALMLGLPGLRWWRSRRAAQLANA